MVRQSPRDQFGDPNRVVVLRVMWCVCRWRSWWRRWLVGSRGRGRRRAAYDSASRV